MSKEKIIKDILRTEKIATTKQARKPAEGIYYVVPRKIGNPVVVSRREDDFDSDIDVTHIFLWDNILKSLEHEYKLNFMDISQLKDAYRSIPRGRIQKEYKDNEYTGNYVILHGDDVPINLIRNFVYQDFGLAPLASAGKVIWQTTDHEKMIDKEKKLLNKIINKRKK